MSELPNFMKEIIANCEPFDLKKYANNSGYSQREWDRTVGYGQVPEEYKKEEKDSS